MLDTEGTSSQLLCLDMDCNAWSKFLPSQFTRPLAQGHIVPSRRVSISHRLGTSVILCQGTGPKPMHWVITPLVVVLVLLLSPTQFCLLPGSTAPSRYITQQLGFHLVLHTSSPGWGSSPWCFRPEILLCPLNHLGNSAPTPQILKQSPVSTLRNLC